MLDGEIAFIVGNETRIGGPGAFVYIPRGVQRTFQIKSETARWFGVGIDGVLDQGFFETGERAKALTFPPPPTAPPDAQAINAIVTSLKAYGTDTLGPPLEM